MKIEKLGFKLFRVRADGSIGPLFINRPQRLVLGTVYNAEDHPTKGYAHRPGWHICSERHAPHLSEKGRQWYKVGFSGFQRLERPLRQGGVWYLADRMVILEAA